MARKNNNIKSKYYQIKVKGFLDKKWTAWFDRMEISYEEGKTILTGYITDQSALHGLLNKIRDLNLTLISVDQINKNENEN